MPDRGLMIFATLPLVIDRSGVVTAARGSGNTRFTAIRFARTTARNSGSSDSNCRLSDSCFECGTCFFAELTHFLH